MQIRVSSYLWSEAEYRMTRFFLHTFYVTHGIKRSDLDSQIRIPESMESVFISCAEN